MSMLQTQAPQRVTDNVLWHAQIDLLLDHGASLYSSDGMKGAIESLIGSNPTPEPGPATLSTGQGVWEVCCMHLTGL